MAETPPHVEAPVAAPPANATVPPVQTPAPVVVTQPAPTPAAPPATPAATPVTTAAPASPAPMPVIIVEAPKTAAQLTIDAQSAISAVDAAYGRK